MASKATTVRVRARQYEDHDDCLEAAADAYAQRHGIDRSAWALEPRWEDDDRDYIVLRVPGGEQ